MTRYFFHVLNQVSYTRDEIGMELGSVELARRQASDAAAEILMSELRSDKSAVKLEVQVETGDDHRVLTVVVESDVAMGGPVTDGTYTASS